MSHFERAMSVSPAGYLGYEIKTLRAPAFLKGANGIRIGPDGRLWICEAFAQRISACDVRTGEIATVIPQDGTLLAPDDLAFDSAGNLYITDSHRITCRRVDGSVFTLTDKLISANGITVDKQDRLYVNEMRQGGRIMEIDRANGNIHVIVESFDYPNACEKGPDGRLYLQNVIAGVVMAIDVSNGRIEQIADGFQVISAIKFDRAGQLVLSEGLKGLVTRIDLQTGDRQVIARMPLGGIDNIAFDDEGTLYLSSYTTGCILRVREGGDVHGEILVPPGLANVSGIAPYANGDYLVANLLSVVQIESNGSFYDWSTWTGPTFEDMVQSVWPIGVSQALVLTHGGQVYRCDQGAFFYAVSAAARHPDTRDGVLIANEGACTLGGAEDGVLVGFNGGEVRLVKADGSQQVIANTGLKSMAAVAQHDGVLVTADPESDAIVVVRNGTLVKLDNFARPTGVALEAGAQSFFVAEHRSRRVLRCNLNTGDREIIASDLPFGLAMPEPPAVGRASLLVQGDGSLVVACDGDGSIRRLMRSSTTDSS